MPIYAYICSNCKKEHETLLVKSDDKAPEKCPFCGGGPLEKAVTAAGFQLKGGGWARDGYGGVPGGNIGLINRKKRRY